MRVYVCTCVYACASVCMHRGMYVSVITSSPFCITKALNSVWVPPRSITQAMNSVNPTV